MGPTISPVLHERCSLEEHVNEAIASYLGAIEQGQIPDRERFLGDHPEIQAELRSFLSNLSQLRQFAGDVEPALTLPFQIPGKPGDGWETGAAESLRRVAKPIVPWAHDVPCQFGDYELIREIARGGMGVVYQARQVTLNRIVAVKTILNGHLASAEEVERFHTEAEAAAKLDHPGIVPIYEVGEHLGQHYFSMGFVAGQSLSQKVADGPLAAREAARIMRAVADAVQFAHDKGVIHRDLKPGNILLDEEGTPRVTDFGLAKLCEGSYDLTAPGQILGTPSYMSPEQAGAQVGAVGRHSDVYSLGAILYCLLTGRPPLQATPLETLLQVRQQDPVPARKVRPVIPCDLDTIVMKCLEKSPSRRYCSARELAEDLQRYLDGQTIRARPVGRLEQGCRWCRRKPAVAILLCFLLTSILIGTGCTSYFAVDASRRDSEAKGESLQEHRRVARALILLMINRIHERRKESRDRQTVLAQGAMEADLDRTYAGNYRGDVIKIRPWWTRRSKSPAGKFEYEARWNADLKSLATGAALDSCRILASPGGGTEFEYIAPIRADRSCLSGCHTRSVAPDAPPTGALLGFARIVLPIKSN